MCECILLYLHTYIIYMYVWVCASLYYIHTHIKWHRFSAVLFLPHLTVLLKTLSPLFLFPEGVWLVTVCSVQREVEGAGVGFSQIGLHGRCFLRLHNTYNTDCNCTYEQVWLSLLQTETLCIFCFTHPVSATHYGRRSYCYRFLHIA